MSNALALATVSAVLRARVVALLEAADLTGFEVVTAPPVDDSKPGVYLHLYQVLPNAELRNQHLPEHGGNGAVVRAPRLALDLHYLISFVGKQGSQDAERLAGVVLTALVEGPRLSADEIGDFIEALPTDHELAASDLGEQAEAVRLTLLPLDLEELSRLWGMYGQTRHRLSVAFRASVVMLDAQVRPGAALPVTRDPAITVFPLRSPRLAAVRSVARDQPVVQFGERIVVRGSSLRGDLTLLRIGGRTATPTGAALTDAEISLPFDAASGLPAGVSAVRVVHRVVLDDGSTREAAESNTLVVALVPTVAAAVPPVDETTPGTRLVRVRLDPVPAVDQRVSLLLTGTGGEGASTWSQWQLTGSVVEFPTRDLAVGTYLMRVEVGGAASLLATDPNSGAFTGPTVTIT